MPIDLTVFNGQNVFQGTKQSMYDWSTDSTSSGGPGATTMMAFETRQRGPRNMTQTSGQASSLTVMPGAGGSGDPGVLKGPTGVSNSSPYPDAGGNNRWPVSFDESSPHLFVIPTIAGGSRQPCALAVARSGQQQLHGPGEQLLPTSTWR